MSHVLYMIPLIQISFYALLELNHPIVCDYFMIVLYLLGALCLIKLINIYLFSLLLLFIYFSTDGTVLIMFI